MVGIASSRAKRDRLREALANRGRKRATADLHDDVVEPSVGVGELVAERAAAVDREPVVRALARERDRAARDRFAEPEHARIARRILGAAGTRLGRRSELPQPTEDALVGPGRDEDRERPARGTRDDRGGDRGVPAARDGERTRPLDADHIEPDGDSHDVTALVRPPHVPGLVLDPRPERFAEPERRHREPGAVDANDRLVETGNNVDVLRVALRTAIRGHQGAVTQERVHLVVARP